MGSNVILRLDEDRIAQGEIFLMAEDGSSAREEDVETCVLASGIWVYVSHSTGEVLSIELHRFRTMIAQAVKRLRDNPLPWTFTVPQMGIREKPLEDVLLAIWKKYRNSKMIGE
jgi:hypothetical protein